MCERILLLSHETKQLSAGSRSLVGCFGQGQGSPWPAAMAAGSGGDTLELRGTELPVEEFSYGQPLAVPVGCLAGAGRAGIDAERWG